MKPLLKPIPLNFINALPTKITLEKKLKLESNYMQSNNVKLLYLFVHYFIIFAFLKIFILFFSVFFFLIKRMVMEINIKHFLELVSNNP